MSKYIIDLRPDCKIVQQICESDGKVSVGSKSIHFLEELNSDYIKEHYGQLQPPQPDIMYIILETLHECGIYGEEATIKMIGTLKRLGRDDLLPPCAR